MKDRNMTVRRYERATAARKSVRTRPWFLATVGEMGQFNNRSLVIAQKQLLRAKTRDWLERRYVNRLLRMVRTHLISRLRNAASRGGFRPTLGACRVRS